MNKNSMAQSTQGGRVVKWKGRTASIAPAMLSVSLVALSSGMGYAQTVISTGLTTPQQITTDANVTVTSTGSVTLTDELDTSIIEIDVDDYTSDFLIDGNLKYTSVGVAQPISGVSFKDAVSGTLTDVSGTLTNNADITLEISSSSVTAMGLLVGNVNLGGVIANNGSILVTATADGGSNFEKNMYAYGQGVYVDNTTYGKLSNDGTIKLKLTASAEGESDSNYVNAYGTALFVREIGVDGSVSNNGDIEVDVTVSGAGSQASGGANGVFINGAVYGTLSNDGTIKVISAVDGGDGRLVPGGYVGANSFIGLNTNSIGAGGSVSNNGDIVVDVSAVGNNNTMISAYSNYGIKTYAINGTVSNDGSVEVTAKVTGSATKGLYNSAFGIDANSIGADGSVSNDGSIVVTTTADGTASSGAITVSAIGIKLFGDINGTLSNDGSIAVTAKAMGSGKSGLNVHTYGISVGDIAANASVSNDGEITVTATADGTASSGSIELTSYGIKLVDINGTLSNDGSIAVTAKAMGSGKSGLNVATYGIAVGDIAANASVSNDGEITVTATADGTASSREINVTANGMVAGIESGAVSGALSNSGSIAVNATAKGSGASGVSATAWGIDLDVQLGPLGSLSNDGSIVVTATADGTATSGDVNAIAFGMELEAVYGAVSNDGSIAVTAKAMGSGAEGVWATAFGIRTNQVQTDGSLSNTGSIIVSAEAKDGPWAYGIAVGTLDGTLYNSGRVLAFAANDGDAYAVKVLKGAGSATFTTESLFAGRLSLSNAELTVESVANTPSIFWTFEDIPDAVTLDDANGPKLYSKVTDDGTIIATVEPANLAFSGQIAADMANMGEETVAAMLAATPSNITTDTPRMYLLEPSKAADQGEAFFEGSFVSRKVDDAAGRQMDFDVSSVTAGFVNRLESGLGYGVTISRVNSKGSTASGLGADTVDSSGTVIGTYGNMAFGAASLTFGATLGTLSNSGTRSVNDNVAASGVSTVSAEYGSSFISPSIEASWTVPAGDMTIRPHVGYRYTKLSVDGFTETGGLAAATFGAREASASDFTIGAEMSKAVSKGTLTGSADILRRVVSDNGASVAFFGETDHTLAANTDFTALELGIGYTMAVEAGEVSIGATSVLSNNGASSYGLAAGYRISF